MLPSQLPEFAAYPAVYDFVKNQLDMQFNDVRAMMKLPLPVVGIEAGCNFATAATLCNLIGGISVVLYTPRNPKAGRGKRFKELLKELYPWEPGEKKAVKAGVIYDLIRNPLVHALGVDRSSKSSLRIVIKKNPLTEAQLEDLEKSTVRPSWLPLAVTGDSGKYVLSVPGLYWGVFQLVQQLARDVDQMQAAEKRIGSRKIVD